MIENYSVRPARPEDVAAIWKIRFQTSVRDTALSTEQIELSTHEAWFKKKYFVQTHNRCFVLQESNNVVGYCRYDLDENGQYVISIGIIPDFQGKGAGQILLQSSKSEIDSSRSLLAVVKKNNIASARFFLKNGFRLVKDEGETSHYQFP